MKTTFMILIILNTIGIIFIFFKLGIIKVTIRKDVTFWGKILMGYDIWINKFYFRIPIRNKQKCKLKDEINKMMRYPYQQQQQQLTAMFSWIKTLKDAKQFEKDYSIVNKQIVSDLISNFVPKKINL